MAKLSTLDLKDKTINTLRARVAELEQLARDLESVTLDNYYAMLRARVRELEADLDVETAVNKGHEDKCFGALRRIETLEARVAATRALANAAHEAREAWAEHHAGTWACSTCTFLCTDPRPRLKPSDPYYTAEMCEDGKRLWDAKNEAARVVIDAMRGTDGRDLLEAVRSLLYAASMTAPEEEWLGDDLPCFVRLSEAANRVRALLGGWGAA